MLSLAERQDRFARALLDPELPVPAGVAGPAGTVRAERFAVYRNNVAVGLTEALRSTFPVVNRLVGDAFFTVMAREHALRRPPQSPVLLAYGAEFPAFIAGFEPAESLPYLADVARLEWSWLDAYHAAEAAPLAIENLQNIPAAHLPGLRLTLHPSTRFLSLEHPALAIWRLHQGDSEPDGLELEGGPEEVLITRPHALVETLHLPAGAHAFGKTVRAGGSIADAAAAGLDANAGLDLAGLLPLLFTAGAFSGFVDPQHRIMSGQGDHE